VDANVKAVLEEIFVREGWPKFTEHPDDRGGPTKGGITLRTLESWRGHRCTIQELKRLNKKEALKILEKRYVECNGIDKLKDTPLKSQVIDDAVLSGPFIAVQDLQNAVGAADDGIIGPKTLKAVEEYGHEKASRHLAVVRSLRLARFVKRHPDQLVFLVGWLNRALGFIK